MRLERVVGSTCRSNSSQHIPDIFLLHATGSTERRCRRVSNSVPSELKWEACLTFRRRRCDRRWGEIGRGRSDLTSRRDKPWRGLICLVTDWAMVRLYVLLPTEPWRGLICIVTDWAMVRLYVLLPTEPWYGCMYCYRPSHGTAVCTVTDRATVLLYLSCYRCTRLADIAQRFLRSSFVTNFCITFEGTLQDVSIMLQLMRRS